MDFLVRLSEDTELQALWSESRTGALDRYEAEVAPLPSESRSTLEQGDLDRVKQQIAQELDVDTAAVWMIIWMRSPGTTAS